MTRLATEVGTPLYVYSKRAIQEQCDALKNAVADSPSLLCYAMKANENLSVLRTIVSRGYGAEVVSGGQLGKVLHAGAKPAEILFSGVGKTQEEIERGTQAGILAFSVESVSELKRIRDTKRKANVFLRINPDLQVKTHPHIATGLYSTKFGIAESDLPAVLELLKGDPNVTLTGLSCHLGSQILDLQPFSAAADRMSELTTLVKASGFPLKYVSLGGGLGIRYHRETPLSIDAYVGAIRSKLRQTGLTLVLEPGRFLVGNAGILLTRITTLKSTPTRNFVVVDAGMNDLLRPSLYCAYHSIEPVNEAPQGARRFDVVGPLCESTDFLGQDRMLPQMKEGDLLFIRGCGAYASSMASNYNLRPRAAECLVDGEGYRVVRRRENVSDLWRLEE